MDRPSGAIIGGRDAIGMMSDATFLIYALIFRLGIIAAGLVTIFLGYSLFQGRRRRTQISDSSAEGSILGARFRLQNVTAGSIFALFGAALILGMVLQGNPEKTYRIQAGAGSQMLTETVRGDSADSVRATIERGLEAQRSGDTKAAEHIFHTLLVNAAPALNSLAWIYAGEGREKAMEALPFSQAAVQLDSTNAHYLDTLAEIDYVSGNREAAIRTIEKAVQLDPSFKSRLEEFRTRGLK